MNFFRQPDPLACWKDLEVEFPALALMAKDILSIPASGFGVERLFDVGRDVCHHYRRHRLNGDTLQLVMLIKYFERIGISLTRDLGSMTPHRPSEQDNEQEYSPSLPPDEQAGDEGDDPDWEIESLVDFKTSGDDESS
jgi:hAT family C-terminal dimerisation region